MIKPISIVIPYKFINNQLHLWCQQRESQDEFAKLLEFPGGKVEAGESPQKAATRETFEEVGVELNLESLIHFKTFQFEKGLSIWTFIYLDEFNKFHQEDYYYWENLLADNEYRILPNNVDIIGDLSQYFQ